MAIIRTITLLAFTATSSVAYAQDYSSYQASEARAEMENARISQAVDMQNMQDRMNSTAATPPAYQSPSQDAQPMVVNTMYGSMYVGPGSGFPQ